MWWLNGFGAMSVEKRGAMRPMRQWRRKRKGKIGGEARGGLRRNRPKNPVRPMHPCGKRAKWRKRSMSASRRFLLHLDIYLLVSFLLIEAASASNVNVHGIKTEFFDSYGFQTSVPFEGGRVNITAKVIGTSPDGKVELFLDGGSVQTKTIEQGEVTFGVMFEPGVNVFGTYTIGPEKEKAFSLGFYIKKCSQGQETCNGFCIVTKEGKKCDGMGQWCLDHEHNAKARWITCLGNDASLCHAISNPKSSWKEDVYVLQNFACQGKDELPSVKYGNEKHRHFMEAFEVTKGKRLTFGCPDNSNVVNGKVQWKFVGLDGNSVKEDTPNPNQCANRYIDLPDEIFNSTGAYVFNVEIEKDADKRALLRVLLITFPEARSFTCEETKGDGEASYIKCHFGRAMSEVMIAAFDFDTDCNCDGDTKKGPGLTMRAFKNSQCSCTTSVTFKNMYRPGETLTSSTNYKADVTIGQFQITTPKQFSIHKETDTTPTSSGISGLTTEAIIGITCGVVFFLLLIAAAVFTTICCMRKGRKEQAKKKDSKSRRATEERSSVRPPSIATPSPATTPSPVATPSSATVKEPHPAYKDIESTGIHELKEKAETMAKIPKTEKEGKPFVDAFDAPLAAKEAKMMKEGKTTKLNTNRYYGGLENVYKESHVKLDGTPDEDNLNFSHIPDYFGDPVYLCQAPLTDQFFAHWMTITQRKMGLAVMVGKVVEIRDGKERIKIDLYFNPKPLSKPVEVLEPEGGKGRKFEITTKGVAQHKGGSKTTVLSVKLMAADGSVIEKFEMKLVHIEDWPDHNLPNDPAYMCVTVLKVMELMEEAKKKGRPGILLHCSAGIQRSVAVLTSIISMQFWKHNVAAPDPLKILQVIRSFRFQALSSERIGWDKVLVQLQLIVMTVHQLIYLDSQKEAGEENPNMSVVRGAFKTGPSVRTVDEVNLAPTISARMNVKSTKPSPASKKPKSSGVSAIRM